MAERPNYFAAVLGEIRRGEALAELSALLIECTDMACATGKKATIKLEMTLVPSAPGTKEIELVDKIDGRIPKFEKRRTIMFVDDDKQLSREPGEQTGFDFGAIAQIVNQENE